MKLVRSCMMWPKFMIVLLLASKMAALPVDEPGSTSADSGNASGSGNGSGSGHQSGNGDGNGSSSANGNSNGNGDSSSLPSSSTTVYPNDTPSSPTNISDMTPPISAAQSGRSDNNEDNNLLPILPAILPRPPVPGFGKNVLNLHVTSEVHMPPTREVDLRANIPLTQHLDPAVKEALWKDYARGPIEPSSPVPEHPSIRPRFPPPPDRRAPRPAPGTRTKDNPFFGPQIRASPGNLYRNPIAGPSGQGQRVRGQREQRPPSAARPSTTTHGLSIIRLRPIDLHSSTPPGSDSSADFAFGRLMFSPEPTNEPGAFEQYERIAVGREADAIPEERDPSEIYATVFIPEAETITNNQSEQGESQSGHGRWSRTIQNSLRAVRDYDARLPCGQGKIFLDGPDAYVLWVKDDEKFLYRFPNEDTLAKSLNPNNIYGTSCVDNDHCYDDTSLFLPKVSDKDAGRYRCRVHYQGSSAVDYVIELQIVEATGTPKLFDERDEEIVTSYIGPLTLGSNFTMTCEVVISEPPTTVLWLRNGVTIRRIVSDKPGILREKVEMVGASRDELDAHYQCTASNADVTEAMAASVVVKMYLPPLKVEIRLNNNLNFEVGQPRVVDCVVVGCVPTPTINWYIGGTLLKASAHKELHDGNYTVSSLTLTASMRDNQKWLSCRVHNAYLPTIYEDNVTLNVGYRPTCNVGDATIVGIVPGEIEELTCTIMSPEQPKQFKWTFSDSRILYTNAKIIQGHTNQYTTTLTWVPSANDVGLLECHALNDYGEQKDPCVYDLVLGGAPHPPDCSQMESSPNENIHIFCEIGWNGGRSQCVHLEVKNAHGVAIYNDSSCSGNFTIPKLAATDNLTATIYSESSRGKSADQIIMLNATSTNNNSTQWVWGRSTLITSFTGLAVLSSLLGFCLHMRKGKKPSKREVALRMCFMLPKLRPARCRVSCFYPEVDDQDLQEYDYDAFRLRNGYEDDEDQPSSSRRVRDLPAYDQTYFIEESARRTRAPPRGWASPNAPTAEPGRSSARDESPAGVLRNAPDTPDKQSNSHDKY